MGMLTKLYMPSKSKYVKIFTISIHQKHRFGDKYNANKEKNKITCARVKHLLHNK